MISIIKNRCVLCHKDMGPLDDQAVKRFSTYGNYCSGCTYLCTHYRPNRYLTTKNEAQLKLRHEEAADDESPYYARRVEFDDQSFEFVGWLDDEPFIIKHNHNQYE